MSIPNVARKIPDQADDTPVRVVKTESKLPCPHEDCSFTYWSLMGRGGRRTPTVQDKYSARDEPCDHFHTKWSPASGSSLDSVLESAAQTASKIICVVDKQATLEEEAQAAAVYVEQQTTLGGF